MKADTILNGWLAAWLGFVSGIITMLIVIAAALSLSSCATSRPVAMDPLHIASSLLPLDSAAALPPYLVPAPAGSSPRQRRQWQRAQAQNLARTGVLPVKIKNSNLATAPGAVAINRPTSPVATGASTATDARKAGKGHGASAVGAGATAKATSSAPPWWIYVLVAVLGAVGWEVGAHYLAPGRWLPWRATAS